MSQVKNCGRLYYLEPNDISGRVPGGIPFPYEDYCISVDLTVETFSRNVCGVPDDDNSTRMTYSSNNGTISFMGGTDGYLTTSYTDVSLSNIGQGNRECIVIESINISYNSWFYPEVAIKFVDVRGSSLMMPESVALNSAVKNGQKTTTSGSFFKALFSFPYPKFTLKVKGFYGKEVTYELAVSKFDSKFNASNGCFDIMVKFIGYMYGVYADLPLNIVGCAPYMDYGGKSYWKSADFRYDGAQTKIKTLPELHSAIGTADINAKKVNGNSRLQVDANVYNDLLSKIGSIRDCFRKLRKGIVYFGYGEDFTFKKWDYESSDKAKVFRLRYTDGDYPYMISKSDNGGDVIIKKANELVKLINEFNRSGLNKDIAIVYPYSLDEDGMITPDGVWKINPDKDVEVDTDSVSFPKVIDDVVFEKIYRSGVLQCYRLSDKGFERSIENAEKSINYSLDESNRMLQKVRENTFDSLLQFSPTIGNVYKTIFAQIDAFMSLFHLCLRNIRTSNSRNISDFMPDENNLTWDVNVKGGSNNAANTILPPFPMFSRRKNDNWENVWVGSLGPKYKELEEVKFTESIVRAALQYGEAEKRADEKIKAAAESDPELNSSISNETGELDTSKGFFIPLTKYDITHASIGENPYNNFAYSCNNDNGEMLDNLMALLVERYAYFISSQHDNDIFASCEAENFYRVNPITKIPKSFEDRVSQMVSKNGIFDYFSSSDNTAASTLSKLMNTGRICKLNLRLSELAGELVSGRDGESLISKGDSKFVLLDRRFFNTLTSQIKTEISSVNENSFSFGILNRIKVNNLIAKDKAFSVPIFAYRGKGPEYGFRIDGGNPKSISSTAIASQWVDVTKEAWGKFLLDSNDSDFFSANVEDYSISYVGLMGSLGSGYSSLFGSPFYYLQEEPLNRAYLFAQTLPDMSLTDRSRVYCGKPELLVALIKEGAYYWRKNRIESGKDTMKFNLSDEHSEKDLVIWKNDYSDNHFSSLKPKDGEFMEPLSVGDSREYSDFGYKSESIDRQHALQDLFVAWAGGYDKRGYCSNMEDYMLFPYIENHFSLYDTFGDDVAEDFYKKLNEWDSCTYEDLKNLIQKIVRPTSVAHSSFVTVNKFKNTKNGLFLTVNSNEAVAMSTAKFYTAMANTIDEDSLPLIDSVILAYNDKSFFAGILDFFKKLKDKYDKDLKSGMGYMTSLMVSDATGTASDKTLNENICLSTYMVLKNLYDRWISTKPESEWKLDNDEGEFAKFKFVDAYFNDIRDRIKVNMTHVDTEISKVVSTLNSNTSMGTTSYNNVSVLSFLSNVASKNGMVLMCLPLDMFTKKAMLDFSTIFTPKSYLAGTGGKDTSSYVCMYSSRPSSKLAIEDDSGDNMYRDDGFTVADATGNIIESSKDLFGLDENGGGNPVSVFGVTYAKQNQSYFKNISVGMENPQVTEASIAATMNIAAAANDEPRAPVSFGQDLYRVYSDYSYTCKVDMMGCAQILPLMYFQLNNIPMFRGVYMITKVEHSIVPGDMTTSFTGVRVSRERVPFLEADMIYAVDGKSFSDGNSVGDDVSGVYGDTEYPGVTSDGTDVVIANGRTTWKELLHTTTSYNNSIRKNGILTEEDIKENLISLTENVIEKVRGNEMFSRINCAYRSPVVNSVVGGSKSSDHMKGCAVDIGIKDRNQDNVVAFAKWCNEEHKSGRLDWGQMIVYNHFCHLSYGGAHGKECSIKRKIGDSYVDYMFDEKGNFVRK